MAQIKTNLQYGVTGSLQTGSIAGDAIDGTKIADDAINSEHLAAGGIDTAHIADDQITLAKMAAGTDGNIITYDASGNPAVVAVGTSGHFLKSQGAGNVPVFAADNTGGITMCDMWLKSASQSISSASTATLVSTNLKRGNQAWDGHIGSAMTESSGIFTFPSTGIYKVEFNVQIQRDNSAQTEAGGLIYVTTDNSSYSNAVYAHQWFESSANLLCSSHMTTNIDVTNTTNVKVKFMLWSTASSAFSTRGDTATKATYMTFTRLGDT